MHASLVLRRVVQQIVVCRQVLSVSWEPLVDVVLRVTFLTCCVRLVKAVDYMGLLLLLTAAIVRRTLLMLLRLKLILLSNNRMWKPMLLELANWQVTASCLAACPRCVGQ